MNRVRIIGASATAINPKPPRSAIQYMLEALHSALEDAQMTLQDLDGLVAVPSLVSSSHFMQAHVLATTAGLLPRRGFIARTVDTGGAGPVTALLQARRMLQLEGCSAVAVLAGDAAGSLPTRDFLRLADATCAAPPDASSAASSSAHVHAAAGRSPALPSPVIPHAYDRIAQWQMAQYGLKREQLAMCASLMTLQASQHPNAISRQPLTAEQVLASEQVAPVTTRLECARRADGAAALVVASEQLVRRRGLDPGSRGVAVRGGGEASGPLWWPADMQEEMFSAGPAAERAYAEAGLGPADIHYWGLYDCFPVCLIRGLEAVGLAGRGQGGEFIQQAYQRHLAPGGPAGEVLPLNTHGGLLGQGAAWEAPALLGLVEAVQQLRGEAAGRQVPGASRALVYGNGGVLSASAVVILESCRAAAEC